MGDMIQSTVELITIIILLILLLIFVIKTYYRFERWLTSTKTKQTINKLSNSNCSYLWITELLIIILLSLVIFTR